MATLPKLDSVTLENHNYIYIYIFFFFFFENALSVLGLLDFSCLYALPVWGLFEQFADLYFYAFYFPLYVSMHFT